METLFQLFILITFSNVVLGIELCTENKDDRVIVGLRQSNIIIGCNATRDFTDCNLVKTNRQRRECSNEICNDARLRFNGDQQKFICQFELDKLETSGMFFDKRNKNSN